MRNFICKMFPGDPFIAWFLFIVFSAFIASSVFSATLLMAFSIVVDKSMFAALFCGFAAIIILFTGGVDSFM